MKRREDPGWREAEWGIYKRYLAKGGLPQRDKVDMLYCKWLEIKVGMDMVDRVWAYLYAHPLLNEGGVLLLLRFAVTSDAV